MNVEELNILLEEIRVDGEGIDSRDDLENFRLKYLIRKGRIQKLFALLKEADPENRPIVGKKLNELRSLAENIYVNKGSRFEREESRSYSNLDLTFPGKSRPVGRTHPVTRALDEITQIFTSMGFATAIGPEIEDDFYNFEALNFPPDHPARDMQDTFFLGKNALLRTHTSPVQIRIMLEQDYPIRHIMPGRVYRNEAISPRSFCMFHQVEGLVVNEDVTFAELKGTLKIFAERFFGTGVKYRFRPSFFPFTEPSAEMDITCFICKGSGCRVCKKTGWLEILGCGMVDPNVFRSVGYDPDIVTGYAFGMGVDRIALLLHGIDDIRLLFENDSRLLNQF